MKIITGGITGVLALLSVKQPELFIGGTVIMFLFTIDLIINKYN